ncbi:MAG TPA: glycosyltransferase family 4 protein, partial [Thermoanaerobaculia bacterium]|nr:glycosyltransferase family 4 protein [Thermoanaerobaculia bacterium]
SMKIAIVGPVYPYRAGIAYCTTRLAEELGADVISFKRQYPKRFYPGGDDIDPTLPRANAEFVLDILNPFTWFRSLRKYDAVIFVWWIWVWAIPYRLMMMRANRVILQCHNIGEKEPARWKRALANLVFRRADVLVVHASSEAEEARRRVRAEFSRPAEAGPHAQIVQTFLPVHELGGEIPSREEARKKLGLTGNVALFFGHIRPFKGLDIALEAWKKANATLLVAGEPWWGVKFDPQSNVRFDLRFIPDSEIATYFAAADVVLAPYRTEAQSGVALTAFHFARPVIATSVGGLPEIIDGNNGILVPPENPDALAAAVEEFFTRRNRSTMERAAAESAQRYSWQEYGAIMKRLLEQQK